MRLAISQQTSSGLTEKHRLKFGRPPRKRARDTPFFASQPLELFRKASCTCGGACPSCQKQESGLRVSQPSDVAEIEADRVAESVMKMPAGESARVSNTLPGSIGSIQRKQAGKTDGTPVRSGIGGRINSARGGGSSLDSSTRNFMEQRFDENFAGVRIHNGNEASKLSDGLNAHAFTIGSDIFFGKGQFQPDSESGKTLLAHELAHVIQQPDIHSNIIHRMKKCPSSLSAKSPVPKGFKAYQGNSSVFHCGYRGILEDRKPTLKDPQNECFYDETGALVTNKHPYKYCKGTPNSYDSKDDPFLHTVADPGGIMSAGWEAFWESRGHDIDGVGKIFDGVGGVIDDVGNVVDAVTAVAGALGSGVKTVGDVVNAVGDGIDAVGEAADDVGDVVKGTGDVLDTFSKILKAFDEIP